ncbi:MAG: PASTA domain-containing protein, partial [Rhodoglobus sp.]
GEQPFKGEQPMQIAYQHANDSVPTPSSKNPRVPAELDELVLWATARDPEQRPRDARAMLDQLFETHSQLMTALPANTSSQRTMVMPSAAAPATEALVTPAGNDAETQVLGARTRTPSAAGAVSDRTSALTVKTGKRRAKGWWLFAAVILITAIAATAGWYFGAGPGSKTVIPESIAGLSIAEATAELQKLGLEVSPTTGTTSDPVVAAGLVANSDPKMGSAVEHGRTVTLLISSGPKPLPVPAFAGMSESDAKAAIDSGGFTYKESIGQFDATVAAGTVIDALAADQSSLTGVATYGEKQPVTLLVSVGPLPDIAGMSVADATKAITDAKLEAGAVNEAEFSDTVPQGSALHVQPQGDATVVRVGDTVDIVTSKGVEQIPVPDVVGMSWADAKQPLLDAGFKLDYNIFADAAPNLFFVTKTTPGAGENAPKGSTIKVNFSS